jgi:hypothetical protein
MFQVNIIDVPVFPDPCVTGFYSGRSVRQRPEYQKGNANDDQCYNGFQNSFDRFFKPSSGSSGGCGLSHLKLTRKIFYVLINDIQR